MQSKFFSTYMSLKNSNQILSAHFICRQFIDTIYSVEQKYHPERIKLILELTEKPQTAPALLAEFKTKNPDSQDFFKQMEVLFQSILQHFINFDDNELKRAMDLALEINIVNINSLRLEFGTSNEKGFEKFMKHSLYLLFLLSLATCGSIEILEMIVKNQPDLINYEMECGGISMLHVSIRAGNMSFVERLIELGVDVNQIQFNDPIDIDYPFYPTPLEFCLYSMLKHQTEDISPWKQITDALLINGANPDQLTSTGSVKDFCRREHKNVTNTEISAIFDKINNWIMPEQVQQFI